MAGGGGPGDLPVVEVEEGKNVTLECKAEGIPRPTVSWVGSQLKIHFRTGLCTRKSKAEAVGALGQRRRSTRTPRSCKQGRQAPLTRKHFLTKL